MTLELKSLPKFVIRNPNSAILLNVDSSLASTHMFFSISAFQRFPMSVQRHGIWVRTNSASEPTSGSRL